MIKLKSCNTKKGFEIARYLRILVYKISSISEKIEIIKN